MAGVLPSISIIIPTLNAARTLDLCLTSIRAQEYPVDLIEIIIADGGSEDATLDIAKKHNVDKIIDNELVTGEAGKAAGLRVAEKDIVALIDSDNILPSTDWLGRMVQPFTDATIFGSEPIEYTLRKEDSYITRYCALIGMNDPLCMFLGNYDRYNTITGKWTGYPVIAKDEGNFIRVTFDEKKLPTIGANGTLLRKKVLDSIEIGDYFFDIDAVYQIVKRGRAEFAKVKIGIIHLFGGNMATFARKQKRRIIDYTYFKKKDLRSYPWSQTNRGGLAKFIIYCFLVFPLVGQAVIGFSRKPDFAWLFHPLACWITLCVYGWGKTSSYWVTKETGRKAWSQ